jgi:Flp pilus assembly protein TadD
MPKKLLLVLPLLAVAALAAWAALRVGEPASEWTTRSAAALAEFEKGLDAERKLYGAEARRHFAKALEIDPTFVAAQVMLLRHTPPGPGGKLATEERKAILSRLASQDRSGLSPREVLLLDFNLALAEGRRGDGMTLLREYLAVHPDDPFVLESFCDMLWAQQRFAEAERTYLRLLAVEPNWVRAQNNLGYLAMAQGQFAEAEDRFLTYRYVAPDQANPHDSLGELMLLTGRFVEARRELEAALAVRPDFCPSYVNLSYLGVFTDSPSDARRALDRGDEHPTCAATALAPQRCRVQLWEKIRADDWQGLLDFEGSCADRSRTWPWVSHLAALKLGELDRARQVEKIIAAWFEADRVPIDERAPLVHLEGMRFIAEGKLEEGLERLRTADTSMTYFGVHTGLFKLYNRLQWADALEQSGDVAAAEAKLREVAAVNATIAASFRDGEMSRLRLSRRPGVVAEVPSPAAAPPVAADATESTR